MIEEKRTINSITFKEIIDIADNNDIEFYSLTKIIGDIRDLLTPKHIIMPSSVIMTHKNHKWTSSEKRRLFQMHKNGTKPNIIAKRLNKTRKQVYDKIAYET